MARDSCLTRVTAGIAVGGAVGGAVGAVYGTYEAIRYKLQLLLLGDDEGDNCSYTECLISNLESTGEDDVNPVDQVESGMCSALELFGATPETASGGKTLKFEGLIADIPVMMM
ncbi:hypothetical protein OROGR_019645 [Orobanche gracilis]